MVTVQFSLVPPSCQTLCDSMDCSLPGFCVHQQLPELLRLMPVELVMPSSNLIPCFPLLLLLSVLPSIRVFSNESIFCIRWPQDWNFIFSISPSNKYSGLISFRIDWLDLFVNQRAQEPSPTPGFKSINSSVLSFL